MTQDEKFTDIGAFNPNAPQLHGMKTIQLEKNESTPIIQSRPDESFMYFIVTNRNGCLKIEPFTAEEKDELFKWDFTTGKLNYVERLGVAKFANSLTFDSLPEDVCVLIKGNIKVPEIFVSVKT